MSALIHILKLQDRYWEHMNISPKPQPADLNSLYELLTDERELCGVIRRVLKAEDQLRESGGPKLLAPLGMGTWIRDVAPMLSDKELVGLGQRTDPRFTFRDHTAVMALAVEPFSKKGRLYNRTSATAASGRRFSFQQLNQRTDQKAFTLLLEAREQDLESSAAVVSMVIKRLQPILFDRAQQSQKESLRPILLLLDETRRIRSFEAKDYITFAREAQAGCVVVYQSLDQIGERTKINVILENVGTQIYLGSLVGNTARYFIDMLPKRPHGAEIVNRADGSVQFRTEQSEYLSSNELYDLPAGEWPALVYINGPAFRRLFLTDLDTKQP